MRIMWEVLTGEDGKALIAEKVRQNAAGLSAMTLTLASNPGVRYERLGGLGVAERPRSEDEKE
jgi:hypothetical protein